MWVGVNARLFDSAMMSSWGAAQRFQARSTDTFKAECIYSRQRNNSLFIRVKIVHKHNSCAGLKQTRFSSTASALRPSSSPFFLSVTGGEDVSLKCVCHAALCCCSPVALSTAEVLYLPHARPAVCCTPGPHISHKTRHSRHSPMLRH